MAKIVLVWEDENGTVEVVSGFGPVPDVSMRRSDRLEYGFGMRQRNDLFPPFTTVRIDFTNWGVHQ